LMASRVGSEMGIRDRFRLDVRPAGIAIAGGGYGGVFNGIQALFRLLPPEVYARQRPERMTLADTTIVDAPRFAYRGMMLDVARTWMGPDEVKRYINLLSYHCINKLHLHLADDEGWRIEIRSHPELTEIGGFRGGDSPVRAVYGKWDEKYGGYFSQEQMRELIDYAAVRNIEIIPEIDLPGHSRNIASVHPEIRCNYPPDTVSTNGYDYRSAWCVAREENYALLEDILGEICELFPSEYINIGGDEVEMEQWQRCPDCRALMRRMGTEDPRRLEDRFMERLTQILAAHGKRPGVWNEAAATGEFTRDCRVYGWSNVKACLDATAKGYPTVVMPGSHFYFDMRQSPHEEGHDWAAIFDAGKVCGFDFAALGFSEEQMRHVVGLQGAFWSEAYVSHEPEKPDYLDYMCFPRICALARLAWRGDTGGWESFYRELVAEHYDRMAAMGIRFRLSPPKLVYANGLLSASTDDGSELWFSEDDGEPQPYVGPIRTAKPHRYLLHSRYRTARSPQVAVKAYYRTIAPAVTITTSMGESSRFPYTNASGYKGLSRTRRACRQGDWIRYDFERAVACREMFLQTGNRQLPKTIITTGYVEVSADGTTFERVGELEKGSITLRPTRPVKAVRIVSTCSDNGTPYVTIQPPQIKPVL
ncbi:MAG: family 20 glycosylhydrolase, partial [Alistipes sp.]|nr:family 20 glycosylhydrolase [Alistipes sp.]